MCLENIYTKRWEVYLEKKTIGREKSGNVGDNGEMSKIRGGRGLSKEDQGIGGRGGLLFSMNRKVSSKGQCGDTEGR